jgi:hypothetical protein
MNTAQDRGFERSEEPTFLTPHQHISIRQPLPALDPLHVCEDSRIRQCRDQGGTAFVDDDELISDSGPEVDPWFVVGGELGVIARDEDHYLVPVERALDFGKTVINKAVRVGSRFGIWPVDVAIGVD